MATFLNASISLIILLCSLGLSQLPAYSQVIKDDFLVNDDVLGPCSARSPAMADLGPCYIVVWADKLNEKWHVRAAQYTPSGDEANRFTVNDDLGSDFQVFPSVASCGSKFVVAWEDYRNGQENPDIYGQIYQGYGSLRLGLNFRVNDDGDTVQQRWPSVASCVSGNFIITWRDSRNGQFDVYAQRYNSSGVTLGSNLKVNEEPVAASSAGPSVASSGLGIFVISMEY